MNQQLIFLPLLVQIVLVFWLYIKLINAKVSALKNNMVDETRRALHDDAWPDSVIQINNCIRNQFEIPMVFALLSILIWLLQGVNMWILAIASLFTASRIVHAFIHTGSNRVSLRRRAFTLGVVLNMILCAYAFYLVLR
ncbi:MAPEG family protein [Aurantivibrio plasticivorans]